MSRMLRDQTGWPNEELWEKKIIYYIYYAIAYIHIMQSIMDIVYNMYNIVCCYFTSQQHLRLYHNRLKGKSVLFNDASRAH